MRHQVRLLLRKLLLAFGRTIGLLFFAIRVEGVEHLLHRPAGILLIANHFSWFDPIILAFALPFTPVFLIATEVERHWWVRIFTRLFDCVPVWRGQVDRAALRNAQRVLIGGGVLGIFPEGGINPQLAGRVGRGETAPVLQGNIGRTNAQLVRARAGSALLAVASKARILPVALVGTERIYPNLCAWRRTQITVRIGPCFGPLVIDEPLSGQPRRRRLDELADLMMERIAVLLPVECRGPYQGVHDNQTKSQPDKQECSVYNGPDRKSQG
jgi:1-acyl-sn-glycerol-3-phosphate acyltransferase